MSNFFNVNANKANMFYPNNAYGSILSSNLDNITTSGFYTCYTGTTGLSAEMLALGVSWNVYHHNSSVGSAGAYQRAVAFSITPHVYERTKVANVWGTWA